MEDLTRDAFIALSPLLERVFGQSLGLEENLAFYSGDGVGKPLGVVKAPCRATVSRGTASQIHATDFVNMLARFNGNMDNAVFIANQSTIPYVYTLRDQLDLIYLVRDIMAIFPGRYLEQFSEFQ